MSTSQMKGIVCGILSGDSLVVRFVEGPLPIQVVCLEHLIAPKYGRSDGKVSDEPFGYPAWEYIRDKCIGKRVIVHEYHPTQQNRIHPAFGSLSVIFTRVELADTKEDIGLAACKAGWVKMRELKPTSKLSVAPYLKDLEKAQESAQAQKIGIWQEAKGFVRDLPVQVDIDRILLTKELECNVEGIKNATTLSLVVIPTHENIILSLAGVRMASFSEDETKLREDSKINARNKFLNRRVKIRISTFNENKQGEIPTFIGCFLDRRMDLALADSVEKGFIVFNKKTQDSAPCPDLYLQKQLIAQKNKAGFWASYDKPVVQQTSQVAGMITSIKGSNGLYLIIDGQRKIVYFNNIKVPRYSTISGCEPGGFEAREYLRKTFRGKYVSIDIEGQAEDHIYGTISIKGISINELLCQNGLATMFDPICGIPSSRIEKIKAAEAEAKANKIGIWAFVLPDPIKFIDLTNQKDLNEQLNELKGHRFHCIVEHILSSTRYTVLIPENKWLIRVSLNGLIAFSVQDKFGHQAKYYCQDSLLQTETEIEVLDVDAYTGVFWVNMFQCDANKTNFAVKILELGFSEIHQKVLKMGEISQELIDAQESAKNRSQGIWSDKTRHSFDLYRGTSYPVSVIAVWSPIQFVVQHQGAAFKTVEELLRIVTEPLSEIPLKNECVVYRVKNHVFRVRIENVNIQSHTANVKLIDFPQSIEVPFSELFKLPQGLQDIPPQGRRVTLAGLKINEHPENQKADTDYIWEIVKDAVLYMNLVSDDENDPSVVLLDRENIDQAGCLGSVIVQRKMATYVEGDYPPEFKAIFEQLKNIE